MAAEIILDPTRGIQEQMQEILALAGSGEHGSPDLDIPAINWYPRPDKPHGGVVRVPDHIAEAHSARMAALNAADDEGAQDESESAPDAGAQGRRYRRRGHHRPALAARQGGGECRGVRR
jgi:hypothetical protein